MADIEDKAHRAEILRFLWQRMRPHSRWIVFSALFATGAGAALIGQGELIRRFTDQALNRRDYHGVIWSALALVGIFFFDGLTDFFHRFFLRLSVERTVRDFRNEVFDRLLVFSQSKMAPYTSGKAVNHVVSDVFVVGLGMHVGADLIKEPLTLLAAIGYLFYLNWRLSLVCLVAIPVMAWVGKGLGRSARRNQARIQQSLEDISSLIVETVSGLRTAHSYGQTQKLREEFQSQTTRAYRHLVRLARTEEAVNPLTKWITSWVGALLVLFAGYLVTQGKLSTGDFFAFIAVAGFTQQPLRQLNQVNVRLQQVIAAGSRLRQVLLEELDPISRDQERLLLSLTPAASPATNFGGTLEFKGLSFRYPERKAGEGESPWALHEIDLRLTPGKKLALVGRSGSGKSTLSMLALRFLDPTRGQVLLDGQDARDWELAHYRSHFAYVSQDVFLFNRSLRENLLFARPGASEKQLWEALEKAELKNFVEKLPQGLATTLGERAATLSGGEKQRLAIARAFLREAPLLILDEATSQLDALSEVAVQSALRELLRGRSALIIAHRLSTVRETDEVVVFEGGRLIERGAPAELLERPGGAFQRFWQAQHAPGAESRP